MDDIANVIDDLFLGFVFIGFLCFYLMLLYLFIVNLSCAAEVPLRVDTAVRHTNCRTTEIPLTLILPWHRTNASQTSTCGTHSMKKDSHHALQWLGCDCTPSPSSSHRSIIMQTCKPSFMMASCSIGVTQTYCPNWKPTQGDEEDTWNRGFSWYCHG